MSCDNRDAVKPVDSNSNKNTTSLEIHPVPKWMYQLKVSIENNNTNFHPCKSFTIVLYNEVLLLMSGRSIYCCKFSMKEAMYNSTKC